MNKFAVDYSSLEGNLEQKPFYRLSDVQDRIRKVAFDVVRFIDTDNIDGLWQIQRCDDGEYIVAMYENENGIVQEGGSESVVKASSDWNAVSDRSGSFVNIYYKGTPVSKISLASMGIPSDESYLVCDYLPAKLAANQTMVSGLLQELPEAQRNELLVKFPELNK